jgi:bla regulator protein BlaR1
MGRTFASAVTFVVVVGVYAVPLVGQAQPEQKPFVFEVVSIKPAVPGAPGTPPLFILDTTTMCTTRANKFNCAGTTARALIRVAFGVDGRMLLPAQVAGGPGWLATEQFTISATTASSEPRKPDEMAALIRSLLEDRFKLQSHTERRPFPVYALVKARKDGSLGPQLRPSTTDCAALPKDAPSLPAPRAFADQPICFTGVFRAGTISSPKTSMDGLARSLTSNGGTDRVVVDHTGLSGNFEVDLKWSAEVSQPSDLPPLFTAIQEQLGLKLEPMTELLPALVIDHVERPAPD